MSEQPNNPEPKPSENMDEPAKKARVAPKDTDLASQQDAPSADDVIDMTTAQMQYLQEDSSDDLHIESEAAEAAPEQTVEQMSALLATAEKKADTANEQMMRTQAELENLKRRHAQELEKAHKYALDRFVNELLGVWDSLELGSAAAEDQAADVTKLREGTLLTLKMLSDVMQKFGVEQHDPQGEAFNPELHQAVSMQPCQDSEPNTVLTVIQKGCSLNGRLVRPAMVVVAQATK